MSEAGAMPDAGGATVFSSQWVDLPAGAVELDPDTLAPGFVAGAAACGLKGGGATDVAVLGYEGEAPETATSAILLTENAAVAAPVVVCRDELEQSAIAGVVVNSGNANAATGEQGLEDARAMQRAGAEALGADPRNIAVAETGVIGVPLEIDAVLAGIGRAAEALRAGQASHFTEAIMTTDVGPKRCALTAGGVTLTAQAKGAGMIQPGFATMLCFVQTDAVVADPDAELRQAVDGSFERITVDGQMSTNDTVVLQASGASGEPLPEGLLDAALLQLALAIVADGEGATRVGRIDVSGAADPEEAEGVARAIANSPLVKTALFGSDPNWGRIAQAAGMALAGKDGVPELGPDLIDADGLGGKDPEAEIAIRLERGDAAAHVYFSDLTHDYIRINAEYTT